MYVNDLPATVSDVNEKNGRNLHWPPRQSPMPLLLPTTVLVFWSDDEAQAKQAEADNWVDTKLSGTIAVPITGNVPGLISTAARMYAAGLILTEDGGSRADTELTSNGTVLPLKAARELIADYIGGVIAKRKAAGKFHPQAVRMPSAPPAMKIFLTVTAMIYLELEHRFLLPMMNTLCGGGSHGQPSFRLEFSIEGEKSLSRRLMGCQYDLQSLPIHFEEIGRSAQDLPA